jgi:CO/xanthine dehydrogenase Mo-binding subunit
MSEARDFRVVGTRPVRPDGVDKVTGRANYGADFALPRMVQGRVLRSPHAHARIVRIDTTRAAALPGVFAVVTGADLPGRGQDAEGGIPENILARGKVLYHGHPVAAVAARSGDVAERALAAIDVEYEVLPAVLSIEAALAPGAPLVDPQCLTQGGEPQTGPSNVAQVHVTKGGDVDAGFADADVIVEGHFATPTVHQGYIEPHACVARVDERGEVTIWCCTQGHFSVRSSVATMLGIDVGRIKVIASEIGGGFGGKLGVYLEPVAVLLARAAGRPVKMTMTREEVFRATGPAPGTRSYVKLGAKRDGRLTAMLARLDYEAGPFARGGSGMRPGTMCVFAPYQCANFRIEGRTVLVNKPKMAAYRAPGAPQAMYPTECALDELARQLGMDPIDLRLRNAVTEGVTSTYGPRYGRIGFVECLQAAKAHPNYRVALGDGEGRGVAAGFWFNGGNSSSAEVLLNDDGTVTVVEGNPDIGGSRASMALMCAEELGIPYQNVRVVVADTDSVGFSNSTGGSRTTFATGMAVIEAARDVKAQLKARAALQWNVDVAQVEWRDGAAYPMPGLNADVTPLPIRRLAQTAARTGGPITGKASLTARAPGPSFAVAFGDVRVDRETGRVEVLRYTAVQDAGKAVHPSYVEGQMQGGAVQGIGWALNEEYIYDERGVLQNAGFLDYRVPVASDVPMIDTVIVEVPSPSHPYGVRGCGEAPIVPPLPVMANAVRDATGVRLHDLPLTPSKVLAAL